jgi:formimidoylglutamate deiminase
MSEQQTELKFKSALLPSGWASDVAVIIDSHGNIAEVKENISGAMNGCLIPGLANLHSHAHQRAMAGLAERAGSSDDSFWTWRATMYRFLDAMQPHHLHAIASQLYLELLCAGYTRVAEFQYLHHQGNGQPYDNVAEMSLQILNAASEVGLGITNLPVHYQFAGFGEKAISEQQQRFYNTPDSFLRIVGELEWAVAENSDSNLGVAGHSLRATNRDMFTQVIDGLTSESMPIHMHIAEQLKEVEDCLAWSGSRPVDYCLDNFAVSANWCLVHATHMTASETRRLAVSGAIAGLCPTTEANLGDGLFNANDYLKAGGKLGIGSDSHISTSPVEELRWFEYGQRLLHKTRNQLSGGRDRSTGRNLFDLAVAGGAQACAHNAGEIAAGKRADFVVLDHEHPLLVGRSGDEIIDSWVFSGNANAVQDVYVGGEHVIRDGVHAKQDQINKHFRETMRELQLAH